MTNDMTFWTWAGKSARALSPYVPLWQTLTWVVLIVVLVFVFRRRLGQLVDAVRARIEKGSSVKAGPFELGDDLQKMDDISTKTTSAPSADVSWEKERDGMYQTNRGLFLAHVLAPSETPGQEFDIFIFVVRHKQSGLADVAHVEFFLGKYWGNKVFKETPVDGVVGIRVSAYGPFLCLCKVTFTDGREVTLTRYIDLEMGKIMKDRTRGWRLRR